MVSGTIAFALGVLLFQLAAEPPTLMQLSALSITALLLALLAFQKRLNIVRYPVYLLIGTLYAGLFAHHQVALWLPTALYGGETQISGVVVGLPKRDARAVRFNFIAERLQQGGVTVSTERKLRLAWYNEPPQLAPGQRWRLTVRLRPGRSYANPGGFDYEAWLFQRGIVATGYVRDREDYEQLESASPWSCYHCLRHTLRRYLDSRIPEGTGRALLKALVIGDREELNNRHWLTLQRTGTNHLIAISGLHVGLLATLVFLVIRHLWGWWPGAALRVPAQKAGLVGAIIAATLYAALAGFSIPTQRALMMTVVVAGAMLLNRRIEPGRVLALAMVLVLLFDPMAVLSAGFWLSFIAVFYILIALRPTGTGTGRLRQAWSIQWRLSLGLAPLTLLFFQQIAPAAPLVNLLAVPLMGALLVPLALLATLLSPLIPAVGAPLLELTVWLLELFWQALEFSADLAPLWLLPQPPLWSVLIACAGVVWLLAPAGWPQRWLGVAALLPALLFQPPRPEVGEAWLTVLDVGQGLAAVVRTRDHTLLFDTGPRFGDFDTGRAVVAPYLHHYGVTRVDRLVVSHGDNDHIGGVGSVLQLLQVDEVLSSVPQQLDVTSRPCIARERWQWDGVVFRFIHPPAGHRGSENNGSCVLHVSGKESNYLLTGDIESPAEVSILDSGMDVSAGVLVAPHHGSKSSSTSAFVSAVDPQWVVIPAGYHNRWDFPHPTVVATYEEAGANWLVTGEVGAVSIKSGSVGQLVVTGHRKTSKRYWQVTGY